MRVLRRSILVVGWVTAAASLGGVACGGASAVPATPAPPTTTTPPGATSARVAPKEGGETGAPAPRFAAAPPLAPAFLDPEREKKLAAIVPKLEKRVDEAFAKHKPPSLAVAMVVDGHVAFVRVLGVRDKATNAPASERTMYRIGSITKTFTATLVLSLRDEGRLRLDDAAEAYLPELARAEYPFRDGPRITVRHLLTHTSGLPRLGDFDYTRPDSDVSEAEMLGALDRAKLEHAPGTTYVYSNYGMSLLGAMVGRRAPEGSLRAALAKRITGPLGMSSTAFDPKAIAGGEPATGYEKAENTKPASPWRLGASEGAGGLWSTAPDMARWVAAQLAAWPPRSDPEAGPIARATLRESHVGSFALGLDAKVDGEHVVARASSVGFAWHSRTTCSYEQLVEHGGSIDGFNAAIGFAPERGVGFVVLASSIDTPTARLRDELFEDVAPALAPRESRPAPETLAMVRRLASTFATCSQADYDTLLTKSFRGAIPFPTFESLCQKFAKRHGACKLVERPISVDGPRGGKFALACDQGGIETTAYVMDEDGGPRFGGLLIRSTGLAPSKDVVRAAQDMLALYTRWDGARFKTLFAKPEHEAKTKTGFEQQRAEVGGCRLARDAEKDGGDGERGAVLRLACDKGAPTDLAIDLDDKGKVTTVLFRPRSGASGGERRCVDPAATAPRK